MARRVLYIQVVVDDAENAQEDPKILILVKPGKYPDLGNQWQIVDNHDKDATWTYQSEDRTHAWECSDLIDLGAVGEVGLEMTTSWIRDAIQSDYDDMHIG